MLSNRIFAVAGITAPILFLGAVITLGALEPGYSHLTDMMSVLGGVTGARGTLFNVAVGLTGVLVVLFAIGLYRDSRDGGGGKAGLVLLIIGGIGLGLSGVYACNEGCANVIAEPNAIGTIHMMAALMAGLGMGLSPLFFFARLRRSGAWKPFATITLVTGILANVPGIFFWITMATTRLPAVEGLIQRLGIVFVLIWIEVMALVMAGRSTSGVQ